MKLPQDIHFNFEDDNITFDRDYFLSLLKKIKHEFTRATFSAENGLDFTTLDGELIDKLRNFGFTGLNLSLTSVSVSTLKHHGRPNYLAQFEQVVDRLCSKSIPATIYYICGLPEDSVQNVLDTLSYLMSIPVLIGISPFYPVPGTRLMDQRSNVSPVLSRGTSFYPSGVLSAAQMVTFFMFTRAINFLKSTTNKDWATLQPEAKAPANSKSRQQLSQRAWTHSLSHGCLTGYRIEDEKFVFSPYGLDKPLSKQLFDMIKGDIPLLTLGREPLDKSLWT